MKKSEIDISPLKKALASLERAAAQPKDEFSRDSVIQRFEFTFELSWKALQKWLEADRPLSDNSVKGILREAARRQLISDLPAWFEFHTARNLTSHTYNEQTAEEVYAIALKIVEHARRLINSLTVSAP